MLLQKISRVSSFLSQVKNVSHFKYFSNISTKNAKTKIVCTLGPASNSADVLSSLIDAGMDVVRMNFSHGDHDFHRKTFNLVREVSNQKNKPISILCDIQGPKIRLGTIKEPIMLNINHKVRVTNENIIGDKHRFTIQYDTLCNDLGVGDKIFINDGIVQLCVKEVEGKDLICVVEAAGLISSQKGCNLPSGRLSVEVLSQKDRRDLKLIAELDPEFVAASFIGNAEDVRKVRKCLEEYGNPAIKIVSKIERPVALKNIDEIIKESDGIMVARGDLGVEIPPYEVPVAQKSIIKKCNSLGRPVITATQMLESMTHQASATRAEASDVFNAVLDGSDAVMLSGETSMGKYPIQTVQFMDNIVRHAEANMPKINPNERDSKHMSVVETIGHSTFVQVEELLSTGRSGAILVFSNSGYSVRQISKYRPNMQIVAFTSSERTARELNMVWGVTSVHSPTFEGKDIEDRVVRGIKKAVKLGLLDENDQAIVVFSTTTYAGAFMGVYNVRSALYNEDPLFE